MSSTSQPITPESFLRAIRDLELEQLHAESARLHNSIFHLRRSNIALEEFPDEPACREAIAENEEVVKRQLERIEMIREEVERRGFRMGHGEEVTRMVNGVAEEDRTSEGATNGMAAGDAGGGEENRETERAGTQEQADEQTEEEGVYL